MTPAAHTSHSAGDLFRLVRAGRAQSRADLARLTGLSASTVALRIEELISHGYVEETGQGESRGGRRPRVLAVKAGGTIVAGVDLGERHATIALLDRRGEIVASTIDQVSLLDGVESVVSEVWESAQRLAEEAGGLKIEGIAMSLPGPVDSRTSRLLAPMRMPGWNGVDVGEVLGSVTSLPYLIDNDANAMAVGEFLERGGGTEQLVFVKAGSGIGCGIILDGAVYRGFRGVAGDISHVALHNAPPVICSCGRIGCLDVVASGAAIVDALKEAGASVETLDDVLALAQNAHPKATALLREAGARTGEVLATIINFFNPQTLALGGRLASADAFVAGVRQALFTLCLPMSTDSLEIDVSRAGALAGARGVGWEMLESILDPARIDAELRSEETTISA
ncbi:ROK family protein [Microbacterium luteolum]|uniref:ROK family transcriptional regulator n=1 Tax=Microbacterium luteolum TaxID=69367 RepID=A0ABY7XRK0_MICLT|nr:ROK family transcriptional regulator [Microbacterium luteolum]WDM44803.1 ROK family transcriptional regulator [Microbacterium luteolum]